MDSLGFYAAAAQLLAVVLDELGVIMPLLLTVVGAALRLYLPHHRHVVEERVKDRVLSARAARRQIWLYHTAAPTIAVLGVALLTNACFDWMR